MIFMTEITLGGNFFRGGKSAELNPFSTVSQDSHDYKSYEHGRLATRKSIKTLSITGKQPYHFFHLVP